MLYLFLIVLNCSLSAFAFYFQCPPAKQILIQKNTTDPFDKNPYLWISPEVNAPVVANDEAPLKANEVLGEATTAIAEYEGDGFNFYDLICFYPANKTTQKSWNLPPMTGYIFYRYYDVPQGTCTAVGLGFQCNGQ